MGMMEAEKSIELIMLNRTLPPDKKTPVRPLGHLPTVLEEVDAAIVATGAPKPVVDSDMLHAVSRTSSLLLVDIGIPEQVQRENLPSWAKVSGLDDLIGYYRKGLGTPRENLGAEIDDLLTKALEEYQVYCCEPAFGEILDTVQRHHRQLVRDEIPRIVGQRLNYLSANDSSLLEQDIRSIVLEYTSEVFKTIREASLRMMSDRNAADDTSVENELMDDIEPEESCQE